MAPAQWKRALKDVVGKSKIEKIYEPSDMKEWNDIERKILEDSEKLGMTFQEEFWGEMETILDENEAINPSATSSGIDEMSADSDGPFREEYWDEMRLILDQEDRRKRRVLLWRWAGDIAAILFILFLLLQPAKHNLADEPQNQQLSSTKKTVTTKTTTTKPTSDELTSTEAENERQKIDAFPSVQPTQADRINSSKIALNRMEADEALPSATNVVDHAQQSFNDEQTYESDMAHLSPIALKMIGTDYPTIQIDERLEQSNSMLHRTSLRPVSIRLFAASNIALAPEGNVANASRVGSNHQIGIELVKHQVNWSYSLGVNVAHRTGLNHELLLTKSTYGARLYREYQSVHYQSIGSVGIPFGLNYHLKRNVFGIRVTPTFNALVNSTYHRYTNYNSEELFVKNNYGIKEGIEAFDLRLQLMYERRITERFAMGVNLSTGFFNQIDQEFITDSKGLYEYSVGVNASYTLMKF